MGNVLVDSVIGYWNGLEDVCVTKKTFEHLCPVGGTRDSSIHVGNCRTFISIR